MSLPTTKNLIYNANGTVNMEIDHPVYGWIPFTASPNDTEQLGVDLYNAAIAGTLGVIAPYPLMAAQTAQIALVTDSCGAAILAGFQSSALGAAYTYPAKPTDQSNLIGCVTASLQPNLATTWTCNFWCENSSAVWGFVPHTAAQIQQVLADGVTQREAYCSKLLSLVQQISAATTVAAVQAVVW